MQPDSGTPATALIREEHRAIESRLDRLGEVLQDWTEHPVPLLRPAFLESLRVLLAHYQNEESVLFSALRRDLPELLDKMDRQHSYARELAATLEVLVENAQPTVRELSEMRRLGRQFRAIAQHNLIEEERDLLEIADRLLSRTEQQGLYLRMVERRSASGGRNT
jgi:hemerythrin superfamily protein